MEISLQCMLIQFKTSAAQQCCPTHVSCSVLQTKALSIETLFKLACQGETHFLCYSGRFSHSPCAHISTGQSLGHRVNDMHLKPLLEYADMLICEWTVPHICIHCRCHLQQSIRTQACDTSGSSSTSEHVTRLNTVRMSLLKGASTISLRTACADVENQEAARRGTHGCTHATQ